MQQQLISKSPSSLVHTYNSVVYVRDSFAKITELYYEQDDDSEKGSLVHMQSCSGIFVASKSDFSTRKIISGYLNEGELKDMMGRNQIIISHCSYFT